MLRGLVGHRLATPAAEALSNLHTKAWGKRWPHQSRRTIFKGEIVNDKNGPVNEGDLDFKEGPLRDILHIPASYSYDCFKEMQLFTDAFTVAPTLRNVLVARKEYQILRKALEQEAIKGSHGIVVTGQLGIGSYETLVHV